MQRWLWSPLLLNIETIPTFSEGRKQETHMLFLILCISRTHCPGVTWPGQAASYHCLFFNQALLCLCFRASLSGSDLAIALDHLIWMKIKGKEVHSVAAEEKASVEMSHFCHDNNSCCFSCTAWSTRCWYFPAPFSCGRNFEITLEFLKNEKPGESNLK